MAGFGFIHDKLDIKILILFILSRLTEGIDLDTLADLTLWDEGIGYFDFIECAAELVETGHVEKEDGLYTITEKGLTNAHITEGSIPFTVRRQTEKYTAVLAERQRRSAMIKAEKHPREQGGFTLNLALSDGLGEILSVNIYASSEAQAEAMLEGFSKRAEQIYGEVVELLAAKR